MDKMFIIARHEYVTNFRRPRFLFTAFGIPVLIIVVMFVIINFVSDEEGDLEHFERVGYVDQAGILRNVTAMPPRFIPITSQDEASTALNDGQLDAYIVIDEDYLETGRVTFYGTRSPGVGMQNTLREFMRDGLSMLAETPYPVERLDDPLNITIRTLDGERIGDSEEELTARFLVPIVFIAVLFIATNTTSQFLMSSVVEEKENRLIEILVTSCTPEALMGGKLIGLGGLALTQIAAWGIGSWLLANSRGDVGEFLSNAAISTSTAVIALVVFVLQYVLIASVMLAIGASIQAEQEGQQIAGLLSLISFLPMMLLFIFIEAPDSPLIIAMNIFPLSAATTLLIRLTFGGGASSFWVAITLGVLSLSIVGTIWLAAKVFRMGMLLYGKRLSIREITRQLFRSAR